MIIIIKLKNEEQKTNTRNRNELIEFCNGIEQ